MSLASSPPASSPPRPTTPPEQRSQALARFCEQHGVSLVTTHGLFNEALQSKDPQDQADILRQALEAFVRQLRPHYAHPNLPAWVKLAFRADSSGKQRLAPFVDSHRFEYYSGCMLEDVPQPTWFQAAEYLICNCFLPPPDSIRQSEPELQDGHRQFSDAFATTYVGNAPERFDTCVATDYIPAYNADPKKGTYGRIVPIIQSSGTGKTRMVHELRRLWPTLVLTLRKEHNAAASGFPVAEKGIVDFFFRGSFGAFRDEDLAFTAFFVAWLDRVCDELATSAGGSTMQTLLAVWHTAEDASGPGKDVREIMYREICAEADRLRKDVPQDFQGPLPKSKKPGNDLAHLTAVMRRHLLPILNRLQVLICDASPVKDKRAELGKTPQADRPTTFYIAIDEFTLLDTPDSSDPSASLRRCLALMSELHGDASFQFWFLLLDTTSAVARALPGQSQESSRRALYQFRLPAWWDIGFDLLRRECPPPKAAIDVLSFAHLKFYGRPLWSAYKDDEVLDAAVRKLLCYRNPDLSDAWIVAALFSQRCCIDLLPLQSESHGNVVARGLVQSHMRYLSGLGNDAICRTTVHSEPMLALAAWSVLLVDSEAYSKALDTFVVQLVKLGTEVDLVGCHGEFLARLLLVMARDAAFRVYAHPTGRSMRNAEALSLSDFVDLLVAAPLSAQIRSGLGEVTANAWLSFTHLVPYDRGLPHITQDDLWHLWKRGAGIQCHHDEQGIDGLLPVFLGTKEDLSSPTSSESELICRMSFVGWQVKNRKDPEYGLKHLHGPPILSSMFGPTPAKHTDSLMTILLELGTEATFKSTGNRAEVVRSTCPSAREGKGCQALGATTVLKLRGRTKETYGCLDRLNVTGAFGRLVSQLEVRPAAHDGSRSSYLILDDKELIPARETVRLWKTAKQGDEQADDKNGGDGDGASTEGKRDDESGDEEQQRKRGRLV
ncbi:uncharacterized protein PFL1_05755 [Pseudozyma flocculosa PF-1]|uniref:Uncharacterized protein n=2 Tax=Pseudozyma flocculosa TaxID=84751 RepID=A0A5C3FB73_9BASI|nr:uncharacterized protein PFL1_05755 [Pseudozyma flocculosa PF-1]EPQ26777.1 hypothetical protein PFL1_05755 [Pseudozyma flocculosa PF-1]SPO40897.1 uncharacterized protein PSFLO_06379 [Pseudozyma flocculosa]